MLKYMRFMVSPSNSRTFVLVFVLPLYSVWHGCAIANCVAVP